jgi:hypothetical protein
MGYSNRIPVQVVGRDGSEWLVKTDTGVMLRATSTFAGSGAWKEGDSLVAVARPDDLLAEPLPTVNPMSGTVHLVDDLGKAFEMLVREEGAETLQLLVSSQTPSDVEQPLRFGIRPDRLLLFPVDTTQPVARPRAKLRKAAIQ